MTLMRVYVGGDHGGYALRQAIARATMCGNGAGGDAVDVCHVMTFCHWKVVFFSAVQQV
jgi:hypothetical protein